MENRFSETFPAYNDCNLRNLGVHTEYEFNKFLNEVLRLTPDYLDPTKETGLPNGVERAFGKDNLCMNFWWDVNQNMLRGCYNYLTTEEVRRGIKNNNIRESLLDIYDNGQFDNLYIADFPILNDSKYVFSQEDLVECISYLNCWAQVNPTKPIFAVGHADETELYIHWHVVFVGEVSYSRSKRIENLKNRK